ncbi:hypothetical protein FHS18_002561 [Paenibacillus phyllosphaerae]|uniref:YviE n=1 Tax=Paenibacillus phyllosphaerae TaxID=274593 RepID=A0A7W5AX99_9BACL|nr:DUF6470 family protein [Paenibacillus phyllosphaerae]MBB3110494.1 hypothetical protein [Paenibacillus phyllosphaerae]
MRIPQIQIHQDYAAIGIRTKPAKQEIEQPQATIDMKQTAAKLDIQQPEGKLEIDQSKARDALALGNNLEMMKRIYQKSADLAIEGIARTVEKGNQMAAIEKGGNPIAEQAKDWRKTFPEFAFEGQASMDNVDVSYTANKPKINVEKGGVDYNVTPNRAVHRYTPGTTEIYMRQRNSVEITPPRLDTTL